MNITISKRLQLIVISLALAIGVILLAVVGYQATGAATSTGIANRMFILLGGNVTGGGYIQFLTYFAFFWSVFDIIQKRRIISEETKGFQFRLLPTNEKHLLLPQDIMDLQLKVSQYEREKNVKNMLTDIIKKACLKFRSSKSVPEVIEIISIQVEINKDKSESEQSNIRYLTWVIPSVGFIGTVLGISQALRIANSGEMDAITATLGVAFDTTLIALILSIIVMYLFHSLQEETDTFHARLREYVMSNLVNRIEV